MRCALLLAVLTMLTTSGARAAQNVTTIAGSGLTGSLDGPALNATFVFPVAVAYAANGDLYIADAGAQRIRVLRAGGAVETLAGSGEPASPDGAVPGGFRDGPALSAQFNHPSAIAVRSDGTVLVADTLNHCIRAIKAGRVTTFAGQCGVDGKLDGALHAATFHLPVSVAIDSFGNVFTGSGKPMGTNVADDTSWWLPVTQRALHSSAQALAKSDTYFLPVLQPMPYEVSLSESAWYRTFDLRHDLDPIDPAAKNYSNSHAVLLDLLKKETAVPVLDLWSLMQTEEQRPDHQALFTTRDVHFSDYGNAFVGHAIANALELAHPWRK